MGLHHKQRVTGTLTALLFCGCLIFCSALPCFGETITIDSATGRSGLTIARMSPQGLTLEFNVHQFDISAKEINGKTYQSISLPAPRLPADAGSPDLPRFARCIAVPRGATVSARIVSQRQQEMANINIVPGPEMTRDDSPFIYKEASEIYGSHRIYPDSPLKTESLGQLRGVDMAVISISPFQFQPAANLLTINSHLRIEIEFEGGDGSFGVDRLRSRYWEPILASHLLNYETLPPAPVAALRDGDYGFEYVIITNDNPDFMYWGWQLRDWRRLQGVSCELFTTGEIGGTSAEAIGDFLYNAYHTWDIPPVAFLILGDYAEPGDLDHGVTAPSWNGFSRSDNIWADVAGDDQLPDMAHGRIPARSSSQLSNIIGKMLTYESEPETDPDFYDQPILTGAWQDDRWFILFNETVFGFQQNQLGKNPQRIYSIHSGSPGTSWSSAVNTQDVVDYFGPAGLGYVPSTPSYLTDWDGSTNELKARIGAGTYWVNHRDHGVESAWVDPMYSINDVNLTNNTQLPYVFSLNCLTGKFDWNTCFAEYFIQKSGSGCLGIIAPAETSYSFVNDAFGWGVYDSMWPEFDPLYPGGNIPEPTGGSALRPAFACASAKYYLAVSDWPYNPVRKPYAYHLFHHFGDTFMQIYSEVPQTLAVAHDPSCSVDAMLFSVSADAGAVIGLTQNGAIVGVADGSGAPVDVALTTPLALGELRITVTKANCYRYDFSVPITPTPLLIMADGSGDAPTIQAAVDLALPGQIIELADGIYGGDGNRDIDLTGREITIRAQSGDAALCVIDSDGSTGSPRRGFYCGASGSGGVLLENLTIEGGYAERGGAVYCDSAAVVTISNCMVKGNHADYGGGVYMRKSLSVVTDCTLLENSAAISGGGLFLDQVSGEVVCTGSTFVMNIAPSGGGIGASGSVAEVTQSIIAFGLDGEAVACGEDELHLSCCNLFSNAGGDWIGGIADQAPRADNMAVDPCFCDRENFDFQLCEYSPCTMLSCGLIGAWGVGCAGGQAIDLPTDSIENLNLPVITAIGPNPFATTTLISYRWPEAFRSTTVITLEIYDVSGRLVRAISGSGRAPGLHELSWDGTDQNGNPLPSSVYSCRLSSDRDGAAQRLILLK
jgi:Peptidase family C25/Propeptide_C25/FlgD Ig-like domain